MSLPCSRPLWTGWRRQLRSADYDEAAFAADVALFKSLLPTHDGMSFQALCRLLLAEWSADIGPGDWHYEIVLLGAIAPTEAAVLAGSIKTQEDGLAALDVVLWQADDGGGELVRPLIEKLRAFLGIGLSLSTGQ